MPPRVALNIAWTPAGPPPWWKVFEQKLHETHPFSQTGWQGDVKWVRIECSEDALESTIEAVDIALDHANVQFEQSVITPLREAQAALRAEAAAKARHLRQLESRLAQYERPNAHHTPWGRLQAAKQHRQTRSDHIDGLIGDGNGDEPTVGESSRQAPAISEGTADD